MAGTHLRPGAVYAIEQDGEHAPSRVVIEEWDRRAAVRVLIKQAEDGLSVVTSMSLASVDRLRNAAARLPIRKPDR